MSQAIEGLTDIADRFGALVLDQWGVLHDETTPYLGACVALSGLDTRLAARLNSVERAAPNGRQIAGDNLEHDTVGGYATGRAMLFIRGGLHEGAFTGEADTAQTLACLATEKRAPLLTYPRDQVGKIHDRRGHDGGLWR